MEFQQKYLKYKSKYLQLSQNGGMGGHLQIYFLTEADYKTLIDDTTHNFKIPGTKVALEKRKKDSGLSNKYPHIVQHNTQLYDISNDTDKKGKKNLKIKYDLGKDKKFNYTNPEHIKLVKDRLNKDFKYIMLIIDYSLQHDVFVGTFKINSDNKLEFKQEF